MITGLCTAFAAGVMKELYDGGIRGGYVDHRDILLHNDGWDNDVRNYTFVSTKEKKIQKN